MNLYILDTDFSAIDVIDNYESLIWTDRYLEPGDFELYLRIGTKIPSVIKTGRYLIQKDSDHIMIIEKIEVETDVDDGNKLIVSGRSAESLLDRRVLYEKIDFIKDSGEGLSVWWPLRRAIVNNLISATIIYRRFLDPNNPYEDKDRERYYHSLLELEDPSQEIINIMVKEDVSFNVGDNLLDLVTKICKDYNLGFKITFNKTRTILILSFYLGVDHSDKSKANFVIFSANYENLLESNYHVDLKTYKNVALCEGPEEDKYDKVKPDELVGMNPKEEGWYKYIDNEYVETQDEEVRSDVDYYMKDGNVKVRVRGVANSTIKNAYMKRREMFVDCSSAKRIGDVTYERVNPSDYPDFYNMSPKEEGWYKSIVEHGVQEYVKTTDEAPPRTDVDYYAKNDHMKNDEEFQRLLLNMGYEKLSQNKKDEKFEGELQYRNVTFRYGVKYTVGDIVYVRDEYGFEGRARVTEYTYSHDVSDGERHYPTFESIEEE